MKTIRHAFPVTFALCFLLGLAGQLKAQNLPPDTIGISPDYALVLNVGRLYRLSTWPNDPPLPPAVLGTVYGMAEDGLSLLLNSEAATNYAVYYSASAQAIFLDDRLVTAEEMLGEGAAGKNHMMFEEEQGGGGYTEGLWLEPTSAGTNLFNVLLHGATNGAYYLITSTEYLDPVTNSTWLIEGSLQGGESDPTPFTLGVALHTNTLFIRAQACDDCSTTALPLWWQLAYFGVTGIPAEGDYNADGVTNLTEYLNGTDPNRITFSLSVTNQYVNGNEVPVQVNITGGIPSYMALLVNDSATTNATWQAFTSSSLSVATSTNGTYLITVGLCGLATNATQTWQSLTVFRDDTALTLVLTNLPALSGSRPFIDPAGYATRSLSALKWTVLDANGATNTGLGMVVAQELGSADPYHRTNWLQCVDLALALGTNWISIEAVDWAGTVAATNFSYVFDTNGDMTSPTLALDWPQDAYHVSGDSFTIQGSMDDDTATVTLQYTDGDGILQTLSGLVERGGRVRVPSVPLAAGNNSMSLSATDAAGNVTTSTFTVVKSSVGIAISPISDSYLNYAYAPVSVTVDQPASSVTINGVAASDSGNGTWTAENVPLDTGGSVTVQVTAHMVSGEIVHASLTQERGPIVFTQRYGYKLDYSLGIAGTNGYVEHHSELKWGRGVGGTNTETGWSVNEDGSISSNYFVAVWPADRGCLPSLRAQTSSRLYLNGVLTSSVDWTANPPDVQWMEKSTSAGNLPNYSQASWTESSDRDVHLFTGGSSTRQRDALFDLSASLSCETELDLSVYDWDVQHWGSAFTPFLSPPSPPVFVPPQDTDLGPLGRLHSDGHSWTIQPDGADLAITPKAPVKSYTGELPLALKHKLVITGNETNLDDKVPEFCVGQKVFLTSAWVPELPVGTVSSFSWLIGPSYVNKIELAHDGIAPIYSVDHTLETNSTVPLWWYDQGGPHYVASTWTNQFANGQTLIVKKYGWVSIYRPSVTGFDCASPRSFMWLSGNTLSYGDRTVPTNGMNWSAVLNSKRDGRQGVTQVFTAVYTLSPTLGPPTLDTIACGAADAGEFYDIGDTGETPNDGSWKYLARYVSTHDVKFQDYPRLVYWFVNVTGEVQIADAADYIRFKPGTDGNDGNIYVTLGVVHWSADGKYSRETGWITNSTPKASAPDGSYGFPFWCSIIPSTNE